MLEEPLPINALANHNPVLAASNEIFLNCFIWGKPSQNQIQISLPKSDIFKNLKQTIRNTFPQFKDQQINLFKTLEYLYDNDKRLLSVDTEKVNIEKSGLQLEFLDSSFEGELLTEIFDFVNLEGPLIHLIFLWDVPTAIDDLPPLYSSSEVYNEFLLNTFHPTAHICNGIVFDNENLKEYVDVKRKITLKNDTLKKKFSNVAQGEPSNSRPGVRISTFSEIRIPYSTLDYNVLHTGRSDTSSSVNDSGSQTQLLSASSTESRNKGDLPVLLTEKGDDETSKSKNSKRFYCCMISAILTTVILLLLTLLIIFFYGKMQGSSSQNSPPLTQSNIPTQTSVIPTIDLENLKLFSKVNLGSNLTKSSNPEDTQVRFKLFNFNTQMSFIYDIESLRGFGLQQVFVNNTAGEEFFFFNLGSPTNTNFLNNEKKGSENTVSMVSRAESSVSILTVFEQVATITTSTSSQSSSDAIPTEESSLTEFTKFSTVTFNNTFFSTIFVTVKEPVFSNNRYFGFKVSKVGEKTPVGDLRLNFLASFFNETEPQMGIRLEIADSADKVYGLQIEVQCSEKEGFGNYNALQEGNKIKLVVFSIAGCAVCPDGFNFVYKTNYCVPSRNK